MAKHWWLFREESLGTALALGFCSEVLGGELEPPFLPPNARAAQWWLLEAQCLRAAAPRALPPRQLGCINAQLYAEN